MNEQLEFRVDNDQFAFSDRYYTNGLFVTYKKKIDHNFLFFKKEGGDIQYEITIGQQIFTPQKKRLTDVNEFDRPFAGWLFGAFKFGKVEVKSAFFLALEFGITGDESKAREVQNWVHRTFNLAREAIWIEQIEFKKLLNLRAQYIYDFQLNKQNTFQIDVMPTLGTKDISIDNNLFYYFGKFNTLRNSSRIGIINNMLNNEMFGFLSLGYKYVIHNTLIEGSLFSNDLLFTTEATNHIFKWKFGVVNKYKRNTFKLIYNFNSKETKSSKIHGYAAFIYSLDF